jgi:uncharacterized protein YkwD
MKKIILLVAVLVLLAAGFYFRNDLADLYLSLTQKISGIEKTSLQNLVNQIGSQIIAPPPLRTEEQAPLADLTAAGVIAWTNRQRADNGGLAALKEQSQLDAAALAKAQDMLARQYFEHISPSGAGPDTLAKNVGYQYILIGENLALGNYDGDAGLVQAWMDSPGHRANILNARFQDIGVAVLKGTFEGRVTWLAVQEFGLPLAACPSPDRSLKSKIQANQTQLDSTISVINTSRQALENMSHRNPAYNEAVNAYNALIAQYNALVGTTKQLISTYNVEVSQFNQCVAQ